MASGQGSSRRSTLVRGARALGGLRPTMLASLPVGGFETGRLSAPEPTRFYQMAVRTTLLGFPCLLIGRQLTVLMYASELVVSKPVLGGSSRAAGRQGCADLSSITTSWHSSANLARCLVGLHSTMPAPPANSPRSSTHWRLRWQRA